MKLHSYYLLLIIFNLLLTTGCNANKDMIIEGTKNSYKIPAEYIRKKPDTIFGMKPKGDDDSRVTSFIVPNSLLIKTFPNENKNFIISGIIFWDKDYSKDQSWNTRAKRYKHFSKLVKLGVNNSLHSYKSGNDSRILYYFSFDIDEGLKNDSDAFIIQKEISLNNEVPVMIGGKEFISPKSCDIMFIYDGMEFELSPIQSNSGCNEHLLPELMNLVKDKFISWKI